jgi:hypothetical protein
MGSIRGSAGPREGLVEGVAGSGGTGQDHQGPRIFIIQQRMDPAGAAPRLELRCLVVRQQGNFNRGPAKTDRCFCSKER